MSKAKVAAPNETWLYTYDTDNRLIKAEHKPSSTGAVDLRLQFGYDVLGNRIWKSADQLDGFGPATTYFAYDDNGNAWLDFTQDAAGNKTAAARHIFAEGVDQLIAKIDASSGTTTWYLTDRLGSVRDLTNGSGVLITHLDYSAFGQSIFANPDRYGFQGRETDAETGLGYFRARYVSYDTGRFLSQDPIGFDAGDPNLYRFVFNSPTNLTDPSGLDAWDEFWRGAVDRGGRVLEMATVITMIGEPLRRNEGLRGIGNNIRGLFIGPEIAAQAVPQAMNGDPAGAGAIAANGAADVGLVGAPLFRGLGGGVANGNWNDFWQAAGGLAVDAAVTLVTLGAARMAGGPPAPMGGGGNGIVGRAGAPLPNVVGGGGILPNGGAVRGPIAARALPEGIGRLPQGARAARVAREPAAVLRRRWEQANNKKWPKDPKNKKRNQDAAHIQPLADGGNNQAANIEPMAHDVHVARHQANGDFARWGRRARR